ncbi:hypothetical protein CJP46_02700 [Paenibacillus sp. XY044]|nr:hypothetical protein CJP46_02700 [Paenibacillus sp. XY044]
MNIQSKVNEIALKQMKDGWSKLEDKDKEYLINLIMSIENENVKAFVRQVHVLMSIVETEWNVGGGLQ